MSDQLPRCPRCDHPIHDMAYVCWRCTTTVAETLTTVVLVAGEETTTIARLDHINRTGLPPEPEPDDTDDGLKADSALYPTAMPINLDAARRFATALADLKTLAVDIAALRGVPMLITGPCRHDTCRRIADRLIIGPLCPAFNRHPLVDVAAFLASQLDVLRHRSDADATLTRISDACGTIENVVDRPADRWYAGACLECGEDLWPTAGVHTVRCIACGAEHDADDRKTAMLGRLEEVWLTADQAAHAMAMLGKPVVASTIRTWADRHRLAPHPDSPPGRPRYRVGSVRELVDQMHADQRERTLRKAIEAAERADRKARKQKDAGAPAPTIHEGGTAL